MLIFFQRNINKPRFRVSTNRKIFSKRLILAIKNVNNYAEKLYKYYGVSQGLQLRNERKYIADLRISLYYIRR